MWTAAQKLHAAIRAPHGREIRRDDTIFIERPGWSQVITPSMPRGGGYLNDVAHSVIPVNDVDRVIDEVIATYHGNGHAAKWCVGPWTVPADFGAHLARRGFSGHAVVAMGAPTSLAIPASRDIVVREVTQRELPAFVSCNCRGWGMAQSELPVEIRSHTPALVAEPRTANFFTASLAAPAETPDEVVGTASLLVRPATAESGSFGYLVGTQVLEAARGKGAYRALVAARLAFLANRGIDYAVTHASSETSAPILERLGFETLFRSAVYLLEPHKT